MASIEQNFLINLCISLLKIHRLAPESYLYMKVLEIKFYFKCTKGLFDRVSFSLKVTVGLASCSAWRGPGELNCNDIQMYNCFMEIASGSRWSLGKRNDDSCRGGWEFCPTEPAGGAGGGDEELMEENTG